MCVTRNRDGRPRVPRRNQIGQPERLPEHRRREHELARRKARLRAALDGGFDGFWFHHQIIPLGDGVAVTSRDISGRRHAEQRRSRDCWRPMPRWSRGAPIRIIRA